MPSRPLLDEFDTVNAVRDVLLRYTSQATGSSSAATMGRPAQARDGLSAGWAWAGQRNANTPIPANVSADLSISLYGIVHTREFERK